MRRFLRTIQILLPLIILAYVYYPTFLWMVDRWMARDSYFGHGFLIPLISLYWIFRDRKTLAHLEISPAKPGIALLALGIFLQVVSCALRIYFLSAISFVVVLLGGTYFLFGTRVFAKTWFPISFLFLMIPLPLLFIAEFTLKLKFFVSEITASCLNYIGIPATREGSYIYTPHSYLLVGDPCSGLRSFIAFLCLGLVFAYQGGLNWWKRTVLVAAGLPLAVLSNIGRVFFLALMSEIYGMQIIQTWIHDASGILAFIFAMIFFLILRKKMEPVPVALTLK